MGAFVVREVKDGRHGEPAITQERKQFSKIHESIASHFHAKPVHTVFHTKTLEKSFLLIFSELHDPMHICMYHHESLSFGMHICMILHDAQMHHEGLSFGS